MRNDKNARKFLILINQTMQLNLKLHQYFGDI